MNKATQAWSDPSHRPAEKDDRSMSSSPRSSSAGALRRFVPLVVLLAGLAVGYAFGLHEYLSLSVLAEQRGALIAFVEENALIAGALYIVSYALATALSFPAASVLTIFGGFLFGWLAGGIMTAFAATLGASVLFLAARSAFGASLRERAGGWVSRFSDGFRENAFSYLLILRLAPVFPFFVVNIAPALFEVKLKTYVAATFLGILPGTFAYAYLGTGIDSVFRSAAAAGRDVTIGDVVTTDITIAFALLAMVAAIPVIVGKWRRSRARSAD